MLKALHSNLQAIISARALILEFLRYVPVSLRERSGSNALFVAIYRRFVAAKLVLFGTRYPLVIGISVGFGTWLHMPIPLALPWGWFLGGLAKAVAAGLMAGLLLNRQG